MPTTKELLDMLLTCIYQIDDYSDNEWVVSFDLQKEYHLETLRNDVKKWREEHESA